MDVYKKVTDAIIENMENGIIPWRKPWGKGNGKCSLAGLAFNGVTKKPYSLLNQFLLGEPGEYRSFKQWSDRGGKIKKGEKAKMVVFWKQIEVTDTNENGEEITKKIPLLRYYNVFHVSQVENVTPIEIDKEEEVPVEEILENAEDAINNYVDREGVNFKQMYGDKACYIPSMDKVIVPEKQQFENLEEYYATCFHELTHSTGNEKRLGRIEDDAHFGNEPYAKEELVAEIGSATICNMLGIDTEKSFDNSTAYLQNWLGALKNDKKLIVTASGAAEKAVKLILGEKAEELEKVA